MSENIFVERESFENCAIYILALFPQSSSPPICLCVCLVPPHVISPSGQPPHQTSLQAVPRCHPSIWLCGMSQPFSREGCLMSIRLHPSPLLCFAAISPGSSLSKNYVCKIFSSEMNGYQPLMRFAFIPVGATVATAFTRLYCKYQW